MSEEQKPQEETPKEPENPNAPPPIVTLAIEYNIATGEMNIKGPVVNKMLCYGMLEIAKDLIRSHVPEAQKQNILKKIIGLGANGHPPFMPKPLRPR